MKRVTRQRSAIQKVIETSGRPLSVEELLERAARKVDGLGLATVYRTVKDLVEEGALERIEIPGESARYEKTELGHHHHFYCEQCDRVFEMDGCPEGLNGIVPNGFQARRHEITVFGRCRQCTAP